MSGSAPPATPSTPSTRRGALRLGVALAVMAGAALALATLGGAAGGALVGVLVLAGAVALVRWCA